MNPEVEIVALLHLWAERTRLGVQDLILANHAADAVIYDVLPPMQYNGVTSYRKSWDDWQPQTTGENIFNLLNLRVTASDSAAFAFCQIRCGGTMADGKTFEDLVRATFGLSRTVDGWRITHQHISKPAATN